MVLDQVRSQAELMYPIPRAILWQWKQNAGNNVSRAHADTRTNNNDVIQAENETEKRMKEDMRMVESYRFHDNYSMQ